jgi:hypothetical protein
MNEQLIDLTELQKVLQDYARDAEVMYKYQLALGNKTASRKLMDNVRSQVIVNDQGYKVTLNLQYYWKFIEGGRKGKSSSPPGAVYKAAFPPVDAILDWILIKPILPRPNNEGKLEKFRPKSLAYLIGRKIEQEGIAPFPALKTTQEELDKLYHQKLSDALGHDVSNYIRKVIAAK